MRKRRECLINIQLKSWLCWRRQCTKFLWCSTTKACCILNFFHPNTRFVIPMHCNTSFKQIVRKCQNSQKCGSNIAFFTFHALHISCQFCGKKLLSVPLLCLRFTEATNICISTWHCFISRNSIDVKFAIR